MQPNFITDKDYELFIQPDVQDDVILSDTAQLRTAEAMAMSQMIGILNKRFDISGLFPAYQKWKDSQTYQPLDYKEYQDNYYLALEPEDEDADPNLNQEPDTETDYWRPAEFPKIFTHNVADAFPAGRYAISNGIIYRCEVTNTGDVPEDNLVGDEGGNETWAIDDPRDPLIVRYMCEISLYIAHGKLASKKIPDIRVDNYDLAIKFLSSAAKGDKEPLWPKLPAGNTKKDLVRGGSMEFRDYMIR